MEIKSVEILTPLWVTYIENEVEKKILVYFNYITREIHFEGTSCLRLQSTTDRINLGESFERELVNMIDPITDVNLPTISPDIWSQISEVQSGKTDYFGFDPKTFNKED